MWPCGPFPTLSAYLLPSPQCFHLALPFRCRGPSLFSLRNSCSFSHIVFFVIHSCFQNNWGKSPSSLGNDEDNSRWATRPRARAFARSMARTSSARHARVWIFLYARSFSHFPCYERPLPIRRFARLLAIWFTCLGAWIHLLVRLDQTHLRCLSCKCNFARFRGDQIYWLLWKWNVRSCPKPFTAVQKCIEMP